MIQGKTLRDSICDMTGVENIEEFARQQTLRWFEQVERMDVGKSSSESKTTCN